MKTVVLASLLASAAAFAPVSQPSSAVTLSGAMDSMPGSIDLRGKEFKFDPLNLAETYEPWLPWFRESELRHCRTAMLAVVGFFVADIVRIPGEMYRFAAVPNAASAHDLLMDKGPMGQLLLWIGLWDLVVTGPAAAAAMKGERAPGGESKWFRKLLYYWSIGGYTY
jgi:light-harvesting complex I chlorophyll a/b binding protein 1